MTIALVCQSGCHQDRFALPFLSCLLDLGWAGIIWQQPGLHRAGPDVHEEQWRGSEGDGVCSCGLGGRHVQHAPLLHQVYH